MKTDSTIMGYQPLKNAGAVIAMLLMLSLAAIHVHAQQAPGDLRGQVTDELGGLIVGATVTLTDAKGLAKAAITDNDGRFVFGGLLSGAYAARVEARGFATYQNERVEIRPRTHETLDVKLNVAGQKQEVTVEPGTRLSTQSENNASAIVLGASELAALPDDPDDLVAALQALAGPSAGPDGGQIFVDNFSDGRIPPKSSIREVRINSNPFSAEYSRLGFGRIDIFTKPGSNKFHGQLNGNFSSYALNSGNPFAANRGAYRYLVFGGNVTGPLVKKKASFFLDFERRDINDINTINATILDPALNITPFSLAALTPQYRTSVSPRVDYQLNAKNTLVARYSFVRQSQQNAGVGAFSLLSRAYDLAGTEQGLQLTETAVLSGQAVNETRFQYYHRENRRDGNDTMPAINVLDAFTGGGSQFGHVSTSDNRIELQNNTTFLRGRHTLKAGIRLYHVGIDDISPMNFGGAYTFSGGPAPMLDANSQIVFHPDPMTGNPTPVLVEISSLERYRRTLLFQRQGLTPVDIFARGGGPSQFSIVTGNPEAKVHQSQYSVFAQDDWNARSNLNLSFGLRYDAQSNVHRKFNFAPRIGFGYTPWVGASGKAKTVIRGGVGIFFYDLSPNLVLAANHLNGVVERQFISSDPAILSSFPAVPALAALGNSAAPTATVRVAPDLQLPYFIQGAIGVERQLPLKFVLAATLLSTHGIHLLRSRDINAPLNFDPNHPATAQRPLGAALGDIFQYESSGRFNQNQLIVLLKNPLNSKMSFSVSYLLNKAMSDSDGPDSFPANSYNLVGEYGRSDFDIRHRVTIAGVFSLKHGFTINPFILAASGRPFNIITGRDTNGDTVFTERPSFALAGASCSAPNIACTRFGNFNLAPLPGELLIPRNYVTGPGFLTVSLGMSKTWAFGGEHAGAVAATPAAQSSPQSKPQGAKPKNGGQSGGAVGSGSVLPDASRSDFFGKAPEGRYKLTLSVVARNTLNRTNLGQPVGNLSSLLFGQSNFLAPPYGFGESGNSTAANRRIELQVRFTF